jgi:subtilisin family serine protease
MNGKVYRSLGAVLLALAGTAVSALAVDHVGLPPEQEKALLADSRRAVLENPALEYDPYTVLVGFKADTPEQIKAFARALVGGQYVRSFPNVPGLEQIRIGVPVPDAVTAISMLPGVDFAEPDYIVHAQVTPNDPSFGELWGMNNTGQTVNGDPGTAGADIDAPEAWDIFIGDPNFIIDSIDTGVNYLHPDLAANAWINPGEIPGNGIDDDGNGFIDDVHGWDFVNGDSNPMDDNGHGTHTSGTFGGVGNNGIGVTGVNWQCKIMATKFLNSGGSGQISDAVLCLNYATMMGAHVTNNSWGGGGFSQAFSNALDNARDNDCLFIAAAGNFSSNNDGNPFYPATYSQDNVIAVAATTNNDTMASFSNYGLTTVDIGAPGQTVFSTFNSSYAYLDGTSMATPHVSGVAALVWGANPDWSYLDVKDRLFNSARPIAALSGKCVTGAVVNAASALNGSSSGSFPPAAPNTPVAGEVSKGNVRFSWGDGSFNEDGFHVERQQLVSGVWSNTVGFDLGANATTLTQSPAQGQYRYHVRSFNANGTSAYTDFVNVVPRTPTNVGATRFNRNVTLSWIDDSNFEGGFEYQQQKLVNGHWSTQAIVQLQPNTVSYLRSCTSGEHRFRVCAKFNGTNGVFSPWVEVTVP